MPNKITLSDATRLTVQTLLFGGGESHIRISPPVGGKYQYCEVGAVLREQGDIFVTCSFNQDSDLIQAGLIKNAIDGLLIGANPRPRIHLVIPYFPGARQDRICATGEAFSAKFYAGIVNSFGFDTVTVLDPHSEVVVALIDNCVVVDNHAFIRSVIRTLDFKGCILSPDAGSNKKIFGLVEVLRQQKFGNFKVIRADKKRDMETGKIIGSEILSGDLGGADLLIVDDICSYGGTFRSLAQAARQLNAGKIYLAVTHYEGVADMNEMRKSGIEKVFTANNKQAFQQSNLIVVNAGEQLYL